MAIQLGSATTGVPRDSDYELNPVTGLYERAFLLEGAAKNNMPWSADISNAAWAKANITVTTGVLDPKGGTTACTLTATANNATIDQLLSAGASLIRTNAAWIRRRAGTGTVKILRGDGSAYDIVALTSAWQRFSSTGAANTVREHGVNVITSGDAIDVYNLQQDDLPFASSDIVNSGATTPTRVADSIWWPFPWLPMAMTVYVRFVERGTIKLTGGALAGVLSIGDPAVNAPTLWLRALSGVYTAFHYTTVSNVTVAAGAVPVIGNLVELRLVLDADGRITLGQSINGAAEVVTGPTAALALAPAWSAQTLWLNDLGATGNCGFGAYTAHKVLRGARTLTEMRAA